MVTNLLEHLNILIDIATPQQQEILKSLVPHLDSITDDEYYELVVKIRSGEVTDLSYLSNRLHEIDK